MNCRGLVSLVGAGPGDPELLTRKALRRIRQADVVVYDRLVSEAIMRLVPHGVSRIAVGKERGRHCVPQAQINEILVGLARAGRRVVRLKGGDPYIFGRGGEEALELDRHAIPFEVVPGVTAAAGCASYAGIPLTHRGLNHGVRFLTGHLHDDDMRGIDWRKLADPDCTLVIYMGLNNLATICAELERAGLATDTPAAAIHAATTAAQHKVIATLRTLPVATIEAGLESPVTIIIGAVVALSPALDWFRPAACDAAGEPESDAFRVARA